MIMGLDRTNHARHFIFSLAFLIIPCGAAFYYTLNTQYRIVWMWIQMSAGLLRRCTGLIQLSSSFLACNSRLCSAIRRHHPPQRAVLSQICCFGECKMVMFQILLDGAEPCDAGTTQLSSPVCRRGGQQANDNDLLSA